jgi:hypothetical protein
MKLPIFGIEIDERFLMHRLRSTSLAGVIGTLLAAGLWSWRYYVDHVWSWDLFAVVVTVAVVKVTAMVWFRLRD